MSSVIGRYCEGDWRNEVHRSLPEDVREKSDSLLQNIEQDRVGLNLQGISETYAELGLIPDLDRIVIYNSAYKSQVIRELLKFPHSELNIELVRNSTAFYAPDYGVTLIPRNHELEEVNQGCWVTERTIAHEAWHSMVLPYQKYIVMRRWGLESFRSDLIFRTGFITANPRAKDGNPTQRGNFLEEGGAEWMAYQYLLKYRPQDSIERTYEVYLKDKTNPRGLDENGNLSYRRNIDGVIFRYKVPFVLSQISTEGELQTYPAGLAASALLMLMKAAPYLTTAQLKTRTEDYMKGITETIHLVNSLSPGLYNTLANLQYTNDRTDFIKGLNLIMNVLCEKFD